MTSSMPRPAGRNGNGFVRNRWVGEYHYIFEPGYERTLLVPHRGTACAAGQHVSEESGLRPLRAIVEGYCQRQSSHGAVEDDV